MTTDQPADRHFPATIRRPAAAGLASSSTSPTKMPAQPDAVETPISTSSITEPMLTVTKGDPSPEELAAVTAVVLALQAGAGESEARNPSRHWARRTLLKLPPKPGAGAWRRSVR